MTTLAQHIATLPIIDTHEHLEVPAIYVDYARDAMTALFGLHAYIEHDLVSAGCDYDDLAFALDQTNPDIAARWARIAPAWAHCHHTGYAEGVRLAAQAVYGIDTISAATLMAAQARHDALRSIAGHHQLLAHTAHLTHVQIDAFTWGRPADAGQADFYHYDINVCTMVNGTIDLHALGQATGMSIATLTDYTTAIARIIASNAAQAVAIKTQHAYDRTLAWQRRDDADVVGVFQKKVSGAELSAAERLCLGDWALDQIAQHAATHHFPIKIHTGHHAGNNTMPIDWVRPGQLCDLLRTHRATTFVLMHIGYPYQHELLSIAKHYQNVVVDLCWAWSINPRASMEFVRNWIHSVPVNKLFGFGGDAFLPAQSVGFAMQTRHWLTRTLQAEVSEGYLREPEAIQIARRFLHDNQYDLFYRTKGAPV